MKIKYFQGTDTLYIEFKEGGVAETEDLDENTLLDLDADGNLRAMTIEHASARTDIPHFSFEQVAARSFGVECASGPTLAPTRLVSSWRGAGFGAKNIA